MKPSTDRLPGYVIIALLFTVAFLIVMAAGNARADFNGPPNSCYYIGWNSIKGQIVFTGATGVTLDGLAHAYVVTGTKYPPHRNMSALELWLLVQPLNYRFFMAAE